MFFKRSSSSHSFLSPVHFVFFVRLSSRWKFLLASAIYFRWILLTNSPVCSKKDYESVSEICARMVKRRLSHVLMSQMMLIFVFSTVKRRLDTWRCLRRSGFLPLDGDRRPPQYIELWGSARHHWEHAKRFLWPTHDVVWWSVQERADVLFGCFGQRTFQRQSWSVSLLKSPRERIFKTPYLISFQGHSQRPRFIELLLTIASQRWIWNTAGEGG